MLLIITSTVAGKIVFILSLCFVFDRCGRDCGVRYILYVPATLLAIVMVPYGFIYVNRGACVVPR